MKNTIIAIITSLYNTVIDAILGVMDNIGILENVIRFFGNTIDAEDIFVNDETIVSDEDAENTRAIQNGWNPDDHNPDDVEHFAFSEEERKFIREQEADELQKKFDEQDLLDEEHGDEYDTLEVKDQNGKPYRLYTKEDIISSLEMFEKNAYIEEEAGVFRFIKYKVMNPDTEEKIEDVCDGDYIMDAVVEMEKMYSNISKELYNDCLRKIICEYVEELYWVREINKIQALRYPCPNPFPYEEYANRSSEPIDLGEDDLPF